jgi:uncharacterized HAD superfamily protein
MTSRDLAGEIGGDVARMLRIGVDVDDVLVESLPAYLAAFRRRFQRDVPLAEAAWEIFRRFPEIASSAMWEFYAELDAARFLASRPVYREAAGGVRALAEAGHRLVVVTGRLAKNAGETRQLLAEAGLLELFEALIHRDGEASAMEFKPRIVRERRLDLLIDDELHVAKAVACLPVPVLLFDRPWNQGDLPAGILRVHTWEDVLRAVALHAQSPPAA